MADPAFTRVHLLTGFLGSGKTTFLRRLLASPGMSNTAVLINELGEIGLDHHLIERIDETVVLLRSGCLCCTIRGELAQAIRDLLSRRDRGTVPHFDRLVVESTGLADPFPVLSTLRADPVLRHHVRAGAVITTVDAVNGASQIVQYAESVAQIAAADHLVVTKTDLAEPAAIADLQTQIRQINPDARMIRADDNASALLDHSGPASGFRAMTIGTQVGTRHGTGIRSFVLTEQRPIDWTAFGVWLTMLLHRHGDKVLRVKGILNLTTEAAPVAIHGVRHLVHNPVHMAAWPDADRQSRVVFIVDGLDPDLIRRSLAAFNGLGYSAPTIAAPQHRTRDEVMSAALKTQVDETSRIPIIDVAPFLAGTQGAATALAEQITRICLDTGFLVITNHGVPQQIVDNAFAAAASFFALDEERKLALKVGAENIGYLPYGGQTVRTSTVHKNTKPNYSESFYVTTPDPDPTAGEGSTDRNKWPPEMAEFKDAIVTYFKTMRTLAHRMLPAFALALDLPEDYFEGDFTGPSSTVRLIEYAPQLQDEADLFGFAPHTDGSFITFLPQSKFPGLEVRTKSGEWIRPPAVPGTFVVNTGEMLAHYSNDRFVPTPHRVLNRNAAKRHAMPFFYGPNRHKVISCVPTCVSETNPARYQPSTSFERNAIKDKLNFPHRQKPEFASESY